MTLFNLHGRKLLERKFTSDGTIDVANLSKGVYLILVESKTGVASKKLMID